VRSIGVDERDERGIAQVVADDTVAAAERADTPA
jgi:hypothetical protein